MVPLSGCPALHIGPLSKNRKTNFFSYDIYSFAINRIYNIYISVFGGGQGRREIILRMWEQKPLQVITGKKQCAMPSIAASFVAAKRSFSRRFAWSRRHKFPYMRNFDRSWSFRRCFWRWLSAVWAISRSRHQSRSRRQSVSFNRVNKLKLWNFDPPLGLPGHFQWSFWCRQRVISLKYDGVGAWQLPLPSAAEQKSRSRRRKNVKAEGTRDICGILMDH